MAKLYYCPRCGNVFKEKDYFEEPKCSCKNYFKINLLQSNEEYKELFVGTDPRTNDGITLHMFETIWNKYVDIPGNQALDRNVFEEYKRSMKRLLRGKNGKVEPTISRPSQQPKDASVIGRGVAGAVIAGPAGAVIGAVSAIDKNMKNANKKK